ncbi:MAG: hypothetical protein ACRCX2_07730 [Paraclostridium sp.]
MNFINKKIDEGDKRYLLRNHDYAGILVFGEARMCESGDYIRPYVDTIETGVYENSTAFDARMQSMSEPGIYVVHDSRRAEPYEYILDVVEGVNMADILLRTEDWEPVIDIGHEIDYIVNGIKEQDLDGAMQAPHISSCGTHIFVPTMYPDDNILNKGLKAAVALKKINIDSYRNKFENTSDFNNNKRHLTDTKYPSLSIGKFEKMAVIFDLEFDLTIRDSENSKHPMGREITISSSGESEGLEDLEMFMSFVKGNLTDDEEEEEI